MSTQLRRLLMLVAVISLLVSLYAAMMIMVHKNSVLLTDGIATSQVTAQMRTPTEMSGFFGPIVELTLTKSTFWPTKVVIPQGLTLNNPDNPELVLLQSEELFIWGSSHSTTLLAYTLDYQRTPEGATVYELGPLNHELVPTLNNIVGNNAEAELASQLAVWRTLYPQEPTSTFAEGKSRPFTDEETTRSAEILISSFASPPLDSGFIPWLAVLVISIISTVSLLAISLQSKQPQNSITYLTDFKHIQSGVTAHVYTARDKRSDKKVIVKFINLEFTAPQDLLEHRFNSEIKYQRELNHQNLAKFIDEGKHPYPLTEQHASPRRCFVQELIDGCTLQELPKKGKLPNLLIFEMTAQLVDVLMFIHQQKVIHRDLKPSNIMIDQKGQVYLIDFGIATADSSDYTELRFPGATFGTPPYQAPDNFENVPAKDYYALALVIVYMELGKWWSGNPSEDKKKDVVEKINKKIERDNLAIGSIVEWFLSDDNSSKELQKALADNPARRELGQMVQRVMANPQ